MDGQNGGRRAGVDLRVAVGARRGLHNFDESALGVFACGRVCVC